MKEIEFAQVIPQLFVSNMQHPQLNQLFRRAQMDQATVILPRIALIQASEGATEDQTGVKY